ncbi:PadR family transcriptional regulator [Embleya hyalina]|uniref:Transcriptional regulator n=1 Tax=Embleya hyalina TaxID=516124 RepID=A0A401YW18_9ACTN|nr:PadR family transcriptional regulator [Embleya hyalina]GCD98771.1 transcriptional regulator [Embleya hyalina]
MHRNKGRSRWGDEEHNRPAFGSWGPPPQGPWGRGHGHGGRGGPEGRGRGRGRGGRARRGDVRASILALLTERPMHGYEMIQEIGERTGGVWKPSPGSVYPTLQLLEDEGVIEGVEGSGRKLFTLTDAGREEAAALPEDTKPWDEASQGVDFEAVHDMRSAMHGIGDALRQLMSNGTEAQRAKALEVVTDTRKRLYLILAEAD